MPSEKVYVKLDLTIEDILTVNALEQSVEIGIDLMMSWLEPRLIINPDAEHLEHQEDKAIEFGRVDTFWKPGSTKIQFSCVIQVRTLFVKNTRKKQTNYYLQEKFNQRKPTSK